MSIIKSFRISWLTDEKIKKLSFGEIKNSKTLNRSTFEPEIGGLFCPKIFGPNRNYQCACQSDRSQRIRNQRCENCGVLITHSNIRRWRMGHIFLTNPVTNTLILKSVLPYLEQLLGVPGKAIKDLVYFDSYIVLNKGNSTILQNKQILPYKIDPELIKKVLDEIAHSGEDKVSPSVLKKVQELQVNLVGQKKKQIRLELNKVKRALRMEKEKEKEQVKLQKKEAELQEELRKAKLEVVFLEDYLDFLRKHWKVKIETGSLALAELLKEIDLKAELKRINELPPKESLEQIDNKRRFIQAVLRNKLPLSGLVLNYLPVLPAGLRPATKLESNNIVTTQQNNLYRKPILASEKLKEILKVNQSLQIKALFLDIIRNQQKRLQKTFDQLLSGEGIPKQSSTKSLLQILSGKEGILRKYSLGKRVDYSARSVISPNPSLTLKQVGIPVEMALTLYKPFLISALLKKGKSLAEIRQNFLQSDSIIFPSLNEIIQGHPVLLNRAPTLHRLGMQGFQPILVLGKTIQLHPLVTVAFNADFDGDQMAVFLPLTKKSQEEIQVRVMADSQILDPKNGSLIDAPTQDIVLGIYYLTRTKNLSSTKNIALYYETSQIEKDYASGKIDFATPFIIPLPLIEKQISGRSEQKLLYTTFGKWKFNQILPPSFSYYINDLTYYNQHQDSPAPEDIVELPLPTSLEKSTSGWKKKDIIIFLGKLTKIVGQAEMAKFLDQLKDLGFAAVTQSGISISLFDLPKIIEKEEVLQKSWTKLSQIEKYYEQGFYEEEEFIKQKNNLWAECKENLEVKIIQKLGQKKSSSLYYLWDSGARASSENLNQIFGMRGSMSNYKGNTIETPILSSLKEGLNPFEFFISVYGAMKGMMDTALKTAEAGYLTRQLVETVQSLVITAEDCQTEEGIRPSELKKNTIFEGFESVLMSLGERINGRILAQSIVIDDQEILANGTLLSTKETLLLKEKGISTVKVRSPFTCSLTQGICQKCYGLDLSKNEEIVELGTAVGIIAAQSLGEPGTQLTMNTFHTGGVVGEEDIVQGLPRVKEILGNILPPSQKQAILAQENGRISEIIEDEKSQQITIKQESESGQELSYVFSLEKGLKVKVGKAVKKGEILTTGKISLEKLLEITGRENCQNYIKEEVWKIYHAQGIRINEKHIELFTRQMLNNVKITKPGNSDYLTGDIVDYQKFRRTNQILSSEKKKPAQAKNLIFGLKQIAKYSPSFLASISFQETLKTLVNYSIFKPVDYLQGIKENLVAGQLTPIGSGLKERQKWVDKGK